MYQITAGDKPEVGAPCFFHRDPVYECLPASAAPAKTPSPSWRDLTRETRRERVGNECPPLTFVARRDHSQYSPPLPEEETLRIIRGARGKGGGNREYILNTVEHLRELGVSCPGLERLGGRL